MSSVQIRLFCSLKNIRLTIHCNCTCRIELESVHFNVEMRHFVVLYRKGLLRIVSFYPSVQLNLNPSPYKGFFVPVERWFHHCIKPSRIYLKTKASIKFVNPEFLLCDCPSEHLIVSFLNAFEQISAETKISITEKNKSFLIRKKSIQILFSI